MFLDYVQWQYISGPAWLVRFFWHVHQAIWRSFSVPIMVTTLLAPWHRDRVSLKSNSLGGMLRNAAWNGISRTIGAIIRFTVLLVWVLVEVVYVPVTAILFGLFLVWPFLVLTGLAVSLVFLIYGY